MMPGNMHDTIPSEYRIVRADQPRAVRRQTAKKLIQRETHGLVLHVTQDGIPDQFFDWWADLRRGRLRVYGGLLRFIDVSIRRKTPKWMLKMIPQWLDAYIEDGYDADPPPASATAKVA